MGFFLLHILLFGICFTQIPRGDGWFFGDQRKSMQPESCPNDNNVTHQCYTLESVIKMMPKHVNSPCDDNRMRMCQKLINMAETEYYCSSQCCEGWAKDPILQTCTILVSEDTCFCENGGTVHWEHDKCTCECPEHFGGETCEKPICKGGCANSGRCIAEHNSSRCLCSSTSFSGNRCEIVTCSKECRNGGRCIADGAETKCACTKDFEGDTCELKIKEGFCQVTQNALQTGSCHFECHHDNDCMGNKKCCQDGCSSVCKEPLESKCHHNSQTFEIGDTFKQGACQTCLCMSTRQVHCIEETCDVSHLECPQHERNVFDGECCPRCIGDAPENYSAPSFSNCPSRSIFTINVTQYGHMAHLELNLTATDYKGKSLTVYWSELEFAHCRCDDVMKNIHLVSAYSVRDVRGQRAECHFEVFVRDMFHPIFTSCPSDVYAFKHENVFWNEPEVADNVGIANMKYVTPYEKNTRFPVGSYRIMYWAYDYDDNKALCDFFVNVFDSGAEKSKHDQVDQVNYKTSIIVGVCLAVIITLALVFAIYLRIKTRRAIPVRRSSLRGSRYSTRSDPPQYENLAFSDGIYSICGPPEHIYENDVKIKPPEYSPPHDPPPYEEHFQEKGDGTSVLYENALFQAPPPGNEIPMDTIVGGPFT
ncbi:hypothetical protein CHS0354_038503 [Potamilus streckersoni]|uniref:Uncharacterized protein n=1 Tax=Potamilus streckersoni TaxID=2493646 RepID=A0AAE0VPZ9_9BIVA|nr:hypothetical protein CHS0354_038503 [Potamilus streckersoni]